MPIYDITPLTIDTKQATSQIYEPAFEASNLNQLATVVNGIQSKQQLPLVSKLDKLVRADSGCGSSAIAGAAPINQKVWDPQPLEVWREECASTFWSTYLHWGQGLGYTKYDLRASANGSAPADLWRTFIERRLREGLATDLVRLFWHADTAADNVGSGGELTAGVDKLDYNMLDGFIKQAQASGSVQAVTLAKNAGASYALQALAADESKTILRDTDEAADARANGSDVIMPMSRTVFQNWKYTFVDLDRRNSGMESMGQFYDAAILQQSIYDAYVKSDFDDTTNWFQPHFVARYNRSNVFVGMASEEALNMVEVWYEKKDKKMNIRMNFSMDIKLGFEELITLAI